MQVIHEDYQESRSEPEDIRDEAVLQGGEDKQNLSGGEASLGSVSSGVRRNPPARNTSRFWFERFLTVIQRQTPQVIDSSFVSQIAPSNEGKLLSQLKFLRVIDGEGKPTELLRALNMVGEEQKKAFQQIAKDSYSDLLSEVKVDRAMPDDLVNFFIRKYQFSRDKALYASKFFLYLAEKAEVEYSKELASLLSEKSTSSQPVGVGGSATVLIPRNSDKSTRLPGTKKNGGVRSRLLEGESPSQFGRVSVQTTVNINLDKDTPKEYWDRVLALLGEERNESMVQSQPEASPLDVAEDHAGTNNAE